MVLNRGGGCPQWVRQSQCNLGMMCSKTLLLNKEQEYQIIQCQPRYSKGFHLQSGKLAFSDTCVCAPLRVSMPLHRKANPKNFFACAAQYIFNCNFSYRRLDINTPQGISRSITWGGGLPEICLKTIICSVKSDCFMAFTHDNPVLENFGPPKLTLFCKFWDPNPPVTQVLAQLCEVILPFFCYRTPKACFLCDRRWLKCGLFQQSKFSWWR